MVFLCKRKAQGLSNNFECQGVSFFFKNSELNEDSIKEKFAGNEDSAFAFLEYVFFPWFFQGVLEGFELHSGII